MSDPAATLMKILHIVQIILMIGFGAAFCGSYPPLSIALHLVSLASLLQESKKRIYISIP